MASPTVFQGITPAPSNVTAVSAEPASGKEFYGRAIPVGYGTRKVDGANIWSSPVSTVNIGGKLKQVVDFAVSFGARSAQAAVKTRIVKLWLNDQVLIDKIASTPVRAKGFIYSTYYGTEQQGFDPTIEKWQGVGNTPAYRGQVYIVVRNFPMDDFGVKTVPALSAELSDYSVNQDMVTDYTPMSAPPHPEWTDLRIENSNKYYCDWNNGRMVTLGAMKLPDGTTVNNAIRTFDLATMQELSQVTVTDTPGRPVYFLPGDNPAPPQPYYTVTGPFATNQQPNAGLAGPFFLPKSGYAVIVMEDDQHTFRYQTAIIDPATGRMLGKTGCRNIPWRFAAIEGVTRPPAAAIVNPFAPGA